MFKKVYEEEFGVFGGEPFACHGRATIEFGRGPEDIEFLERMSQVAAAAHAPFITGGCAGPVQPGELSRSSTRRAIWPRCSTPPNMPAGRVSA